MYFTNLTLGLGVMILLIITIGKLNCSMKSLTSRRVHYRTMITWLQNYCTLGYIAWFYFEPCRKHPLYFGPIPYIISFNHFQYDNPGFLHVMHTCFMPCWSSVSQFELTIMVSTYNFTTFKTVGKLYD